MRFGATWIVTPSRSFFAPKNAAAICNGLSPRFERYNANVFSYELICRRCGWRTVCGVDDAIARLRLIGLLRREREPDEDLVAALLVEAAPRMTCPVCKEKQMVARPFDAADDKGEWLSAVLCEICRTPIPPERLNVIPGTKRCAKCQGLSEAGRLSDEEPDYCPHCGALIELRVSRGGGITRYKRVCTGTPPCRLD
jgi:hypothetical protein